MPRNDAKRTNKNTKRLPIVVKIKINKKKRTNKNNKKTTNQNKRKSSTTTITQKQNYNNNKNNNSKLKQQGEEAKEESSNNLNGTNENWIKIKQISGSSGGGNGGGDTTCDANPKTTTTLSVPSKRRRNFNKNKITRTLTPCELPGPIPPIDQEQQQGHQTNSTPVVQEVQAEKRNSASLFLNLSEEQKNEDDTRQLNIISNYKIIVNNNLFQNFNNNNNNKSLVTNNRNNLESKGTTTQVTTVSSSSSTADLLSFSSSSNQEYLHHHNTHHHQHHHHRPSTLYPIVIETHIPETLSPLPQYLNNTKTTTTKTLNSIAVPPTTETETVSSLPPTTKHSTPLNVVACCNNTKAAASATETKVTFSTAYTAAAVDTLLETQKLEEKFQKKNVVAKQRNHRKEQQQHQQREDFYHTEEVKARLATLRARKVVIVANDKPQQKGHSNQEQQQQQQQQQKAKLKEIAFEKNSTVAEISRFEECECISDKRSNTFNATPFLKRAFPQPFDEATLNRIETLSDNEVKKPINKRKRNQTAALLLGLNNIQPARSKRIAASTASAAAAAILQTVALATSATATATATASATGDSNSSNNNKQNKQTTLVAPLEIQQQSKESRRQLSLSRDFLKPLPIESVNTNSKKRPRIMSLYERPYQTTSDGRGNGGSVVGNGYMSTSRSSSSGGGGSSGGGALVMSDSNDSQEMANQYFLSGTSGSGIAGNSSSSALLGNGSAINHAPSMGTLCNIGNTCYLNSVVYTLRFAPQFLHNLHHLLADLNALQQNIARARAKSSSLGRGISAVHMENARSWSSKDLVSMEQYAPNVAAGAVIVNATASSAVPNSATTAGSSSALTQVTQKSSHQVLTEKLHDLYQSLYRNEMSESTEPHHADTLLHAIQDVSTIFEGNQQQDAHEFLMCVLNSIRETSQTLLKAIAECPDVILNGYIANPDENERDIKHSNLITGGSGGGGLVGGSSNNAANNMSVSSALSSLTSNTKSSLFFSLKSKRKDETKNSKNTRLQSPLKDNQLPGGGGSLTTQSNSLFYLNANDLNSSSASSSTSPPSVAGGAVGASGSITSPSNSTGAVVGASDDIDNSSSLALLLKDKQRLECKIREMGLDFFNDDFEGITVSTTKCLSCETITEQKETMIDIAVPVPQAGYESNEFTDRPSSFIQNSCITREYFRNENKYRCEQCCGYTEAIRSISYEVLPRLLIIQLSRFSGGMEKINSYIPTSFTLQCFCSKCCELSDANKLHIYKLYSVITHVGATMSVGHYIAYTCSLDWANEYINCPKEQRRRASQERAAAAANAANGGGTNSAALGQHGTSNVSQTATNAINLGSTTTNSSSSSSTTGFMKIMKFGRNKASSSGDMSKNVKHINGLTSSSKAITNGIGKLTMNNSGGSSATSNASQCSSSTTCQSINCCAMRLTAQQQLHYLHTSQTNASDLSENDLAASGGYSSSSSFNNSNYNNNAMQQPYTTASASIGVSGGIASTSSGYGSTGRGATKASYASQNHNGSEPIWYMCDDDKIKAMTQREFEELLSPARKITITPYLLFYARYNLQTSSTTPPKSSSSSSPGPVTSSPQASWSTESLQSSGHSAHSSGMRM